MKIVIDIDDEDYKRIQDISYVFDILGISITSRIYSAIINGTPLPEHHGDLIDRDALIYDADYYEPLISKRDVDFAPTIIEGSNNNDKRRRY